jgi:hypothetical protein
MNAFLDRFPLRVKLVTLMGVLVGAIALVLFLVFPAQMEAIARQGVETRANTMARVIAKGLQPGLEYDDSEYVDSLLETLESTGEVDYAYLQRSDDSLLGGYRAERRPRRLALDATTEPRNLTQGNRMHTVILLSVGAGAERRTGTLGIGFSLDQLERDVQRNRWTAALASILVFVLGLGVSYLIGTGLTRQIASSASQIASAATQMHAAAQAQEAAGTEQLASAEEVSRTVQSLLESAGHIADSAAGVLENAERARETSELTAAKITELSAHANRIAEILDAIREIADRSDLLALNASLEATRAGEAGRSFSLVAAEMRRLAERVTASVEDVKSLVADVRSSGSSTVVATEENLKLVDGTTESARQITLVTQQQQSATEQVVQSMRDMGRVVQDSVTSIQTTRDIAEALKGESERLARVVGTASNASSASRTLGSKRDARTA